MSSTLQLLTVRVAVSLFPSVLKNVREGVETVLSGMLMKYNRDLQGVLLSYDNVRIPEHVGYIVDELPFIRIHVEFEGVVFCPIIGSTVVGVVNKVGAEHVGMLVHGMFNASIPKDKRLKKVAVDDRVEFVVQSLYESRGLLALEGALPPKA